MAREKNHIVLRDVELLPKPWLNFTGREGRYNRAGQRNFGVVLDADVANELLNVRGMNVKMLKPREEDLEEDPNLQPRYWLPVEVAYDKGQPPKVAIVTESRGLTLLDEEEVHLIDHADIVKVDMVINPWAWKQPSGDSGVKAYLRSIYVTIDEDELEAEYADMARQ